LERGIVSTPVVCAAKVYSRKNVFKVENITFPSLLMSRYLQRRPQK